MVLKEDLASSTVIIDLVLRITAIEKLLLNKKIITDDEYKEELNSVLKQMTDILKVNGATEAADALNLSVIKNISQNNE